MKLVELEIHGFGKLEDRRVRFDPAFNVVTGANEAGKSTLSAAILALLYGLGRGEKERWRPWSGARFAARLIYALADGRTFEIQREFERDSKGIRVYDEAGNDASAACAVAKAIVPGEAHLGLPLEVFTNAAFVAQGDVPIDGFRAERIAHSLARALDGGPREDAALGAIARLENAIADHVGRKRATVNAPLRHLYDELAESEARANEMRERLRALDELRARLGAERAKALERDGALRRLETRGLAMRAHALRSRIEALREIRDDLAALAAERSEYDDVLGFRDDAVPALANHYREWYATDALAREQRDEAERGRMTPALAAELDERNRDGGALDDEAFAALEDSARASTAARDRATSAADRAQAARRNIEGGSELFGALFTAGAFVAVGAGVLAFFAEYPFAVGVGVVALILFAFAWSRWSRRRSAARTAHDMQRRADAAVAEERAAAEHVASILGPLGVPSVDELGRRRVRALELRARKAEAARLAGRAGQTRRDADAAAAAFDGLAARLVEPTGSRANDLAAAERRAERKRARDGIDMRLSMLDVRRGDVLGNDDEFALEAELADLLASGVEPVAAPDGASTRAFEAERADLRRRANDGERTVAGLEAELAANESNVGDVAALDERTAHLRARAARLERFDADVELARATIDRRTREAHQKFARRLSDYASSTFAAVTRERYAELRVDPTTLAVRARAPESGAIVDVEALSAGTREQAYLVTRLAMARMFSEGAETAPLLLDDPFALWDEARIERCLPVLEAVAREGAQLTLFTTSASLARAVARIGGAVHALDALDATAAQPSSERRQVSPA